MYDQNKVCSKPVTNGLYILHKNIISDRNNKTNFFVEVFLKKFDNADCKVSLGTDKYVSRKNDYKNSTSSLRIFCSITKVDNHPLLVAR